MSADRESVDALAEKVLPALRACRNHASFSDANCARCAALDALAKLEARAEHADKLEEEIRAFLWSKFPAGHGPTRDADIDRLAAALREGKPE